jgi:metallopeptidase MepB
MSAASVLMINFPPPTENKPTLLSHEYLRRLFHELGHAMHSLLSKTKCSRFHGPPRINRDFAEAVSIMFENFLWIPEIMSDVSLHYSYLDSRYREAWMAENMNAQQPPRQMKKELIQSIVDGRSAGEVGRIITIIFQSLFDLAIHTAATSEDIKNLDLQSLWNSSIVEITGRTGPDEDHGDMHRWGHGFSGFRAPVSGYDAGYFTYVLSRVVSFDLFESGFKSDPLSPVLGARYREIILQPGGSKDVDDIVLEFLGREVSDAAFKNSMGL